MATNPTEIDESTRTPPSPAQIPTIQPPEFELAVDQPEAPSLASTLKLPDDSPRYLSPKNSTSELNAGLHTLSLSDLLSSTEGGLESLGPDAATAEINVAPDESYIDMTSAPLAREMKRRFDQLAGVGATLRSPFIITAYVTQYGKRFYRLGFRDDAPVPAPVTAAQSEDTLVQVAETTHSPRAKRRSRLSMHFTPQALFSKSNQTPPARPTTTTSTTPRKLHRRTRSIPDLVSTGLGDGEKSDATAPTYSTTGRGHSQSVTAADQPRRITLQTHPLPVLKSEPFYRVMCWDSQQGIKISNLGSHLTDKKKVHIAPFGPGVAFHIPSKDLPMDKVKPQDSAKFNKRVRPMQSFESGVTARQDDREDPPEVGLEDEHELSRPPSAIRLSQMTTISESSTSDQFSLTTTAVDENISPESLQLSSQYSTEVFNVLQTYKGFPILDTFFPEIGTATTSVIRLSLTTETSAAPRDDPRFVLWGEFYPEHEGDDYRSTSRDSLTDASQSISSPTSSKRRSSKVSRMKSPESSTLRLSLPPPAPSVEPPQRVLLAATIERWLAQLTSDLNYDELLNFFLTYRAYISPADLCHLLICRFHWALQKPQSPEDQTVRRIVRVRTFVALRYWMVTFFTVDFIPHREVRLLIADWLNTLRHDTVLQKHMDGYGIIRRLIKVAKDCKKAHIKVGDKPKPVSPPRPTSVLPPRGTEHLLGQSFANATRKDVDEESDLDLDFLPDEANSDTSPIGFPSDPANAHLAVGGVLPNARPTSLPLTNMNILQRTDHAPGYLPAPGGRVQTLPASTRHSAISRAFDRTIGRLGRWKRKLNTKSYSTKGVTVPLIATPAAGPSSAASISAFDLELNASRDMLAASGTVEEYLKMPVPSSAPAVMRPLSSSSNLFRPPPAPLIPIPPVPPLPPDLATRIPSPDLEPYVPLATASPPGLDSSSLKQDHPQNTGSPSIDHTALPSELPSSPSERSSLPSPPPSPPAYSIDDPPEIAPDETPLEPIDLATTQASFNYQVASLGSSERAQSFRSSSTDSFGEPLTGDGIQQPSFSTSGNPWQFDVVSIDDLDFSDTSSFMDSPDPISPPGLSGLPGLKKQTRKLPMRKDFEFVRRSEVSSMGIISQDSLRDSIGSMADEVSPTSSMGGGPMPIQRWQMKTIQQTFEAMSTGSGDKGDVEDALRRLEGQINPSTVQENEEKVNGWVRNLQERMTNGDYEYSIYSDDEVESFIDEVGSSPTGTRSASPGGLKISALDTDEEGVEGALTPVPTQTEYQLPTPPGLEAPPTAAGHKPIPDEVVPLEILQSRMSRIDMGASTDTLAIAPRSSSPSPSRAITPRNNPEQPMNSRPHRPFNILSFPADTLARHFAMIDRELFMTVKFEELITGEWSENDDSEVLDWAQYLKDRTRWKEESRMPHKTTALAALRTRFNLMVSFVNSEIVLAAPQERVTVVNKFIRIAWNCYDVNNFHTLAAIIYALNSEYVKAAMKGEWNRVGLFESRMLSDLTTFASAEKDFKFMRQTVDAIADAKHPDSSSRTPSIISGGTSDSQSAKAKQPTACIPFIGIYLTQLHRHFKLPSVIDPTAPTTIVGLDPITAQFDPLADPQVFSTLRPLPPSMQLEPLVNVHKQRRIAEVIKSLVAGQHLASRAQFTVDRKLFQKCLRLKGHEAAYLKSALRARQGTS